MQAENNNTLEETSLWREGVDTSIYTRIIRQRLNTTCHSAAAVHRILTVAGTWLEERIDIRDARRLLVNNYRGIPTMTIELTPAELRLVLDFTVSLARKAGDLILEGSEAIRTAEIGTKTNSVDLVTQYDVRVEEFVQREIAGMYPDFKLYVGFYN
jgi:hypothetical protein